MTRYIDGYVLPVPKKHLKAYFAMARRAARIWRELGALDYKESAGDDLDVKWGPGFPRGIRIKRGETVVFSSIEFRSRAHRDRVNARAMKDPRFAAMMNETDVPFNPKRMLYGGFKVMVGG